MKVHLQALGCRLNEAELEQWSQEFQAKGMQIADGPEDADLVVLNSCAVTHQASRKSRHQINRLNRYNPQAKLVVTGCHSSLHPDEAASTMGVDLVVSNAEKDQLPALTMQALELPTMPTQATEPEAIALYSRGRHRAFIKIQDGCRYRCTFCIVTVARGEERSRSEADILQEIRRFSDQGIKEIVLAGVHVGGYGSDTDTNLFELVQAILRETDIPRIRFASVEPWDLPDDFFTLFENPRVMPHMHLPLQSGSDTVLRRMARRCKTAQFAELVAKARASVPHFNITTDIIAGFPGETEEEWQQTMAFVDQIGFGHIHIFRYSPREGTKASRMENPVNDKIKARRCKEMANLAEKSRRKILATLTDSTSNVLWEKPVTTEVGVTHTGYTEHFHRIETTAAEDSNLEYQVTNTRITAVNTTAEHSLLKGVIAA